MSKQQIEDEFSIRALVAAYSDATNRGDLQGMVDVYASDGVLVPFAGKEYVGHAQIREVVGQTVSAYSWIFQMTHSGLINVEGDTGVGRFWVSEWAKRTDGRGTQFMGLYQDRYVRTTQGWRFARRQLDATFLGQVAFEGKSPVRPAYDGGLWPLK